MLEAAREAIQIAGEHNQDASTSTRLLALALAKCFLSIGQAAQIISKETRRLYPYITWDRLIALRSKCLEEHKHLNTDVLRKCAAEELPHLISHLETILVESYVVKDAAMFTGVVVPMRKEVEYNFEAAVSDEQLLHPAIINCETPRRKFETSAWEHLATSNHPAVSALRTQIDSWHRNLEDDTARVKLKKRLASPDTHMSAFYELFFCEFFRRKGWQTEKDPWIENTRPDLLVTLPNQSKMILEVFSLNDSERLQKHKQVFFDFLVELDQTDTQWALAISLDSWPSVPNYMPALQRIRQWLKVTGPAVIRESTLMILIGEAALTITAQQSGMRKHMSGCIYQWRFPEQTPMSVEKKMKSSFQYKMWRYDFLRNSDMPFVIAVGGQDNSPLDEVALAKSLYGNISVYEKLNRPRRLFIHTDGGHSRLASRPHVSGVVFVNRLWNHTQMMYNACVLHNPWAARPLVPLVFGEMPQLVVKDRGRSFIELEWSGRAGRLMAF